MSNILFICSANKDRSATAERVCSEKFNNFNFNSAGTNEKICWQLGTTYVNQELIDWSTRIFVMEQKHQRFLINNFQKSSTTKITVLAIQDTFKFMEPKLIQRIEMTIFPLIQALYNKL